MNMPFENPCPGQAKGLSSYYFTQVVHMILASHCLIGNPEDYPRDYGSSLNNSEEFDFIIVGGGSAGSVVANRLSEINKWRILLLEAGDNPTFESDIPGFSLSLPGRDLDWKFATEKSENTCLGIEDESCAIFQGKVLGGTSTINKIHYLRGNPQDYDDWKEFGNEGWGYDEILKYFKKSEKIDEEFQIIGNMEYEENYKKWKKEAGSNFKKLYELSKIVSGKYHSKAGFLRVNHFAHDSHLFRLKNELLAAAEEIGVPHLTDINTKSQIGFVQAMGAIHEGNRGNSAKAFLGSVKARKNLFVVRNATVQHLIIENKKVKGVKCIVNGKSKTIYAKKETILSAGAINSPRLLMLSGIGPSQHLKNFGIKVTQNLPGVGKNFQSHLSFFGLPFIIDQDNSKAITHLQKIDAMYQFISRGTGFYGSIGLNDVIGFINTENNTNVPNIQYLNYLNHINDYYTFNELMISLKIKNEIRDEFARAYARSNILLICPTLLVPKSRGVVELSGNSFHHKPKIIPKFLEDKEDVKTLIKSIKIAIQLTQTNALKKLNPELLKLNIDNCTKFDSNEDEYWECLIRHLTSSMHDVAGTCKMGPLKDPMAVVDEKLKVHNIKGLRVVDSSIMPVIVRGSTSVASVMIGEKASDMIKEDWKRIKHTEL